MDDGGLYIAVFRLSRARRIRVGRLGEFDFEAGTYYYVGSARRNRTARLARHGRRRKPLRWHVDYLSVWARMLGAILIDADSAGECELAEELARRMVRPVNHFGASDCRCKGHLLWEKEDRP
jgi:sugar fermentation stimulation protein A